MADMSFEFQSEARVWIVLGDAANDYASPLKLTITQAARLYELLGAALRAHKVETDETLSALTRETVARPS